jgi:hypothetical protein
VMDETKEELERGALERFLRSQPALGTAPWGYLGAHHERPDFVSADDIGIELGEWLHEAQTQGAREIDRFEEEIITGAGTRGMTVFLKSFEAAEEPRYQVALHVAEVPTRRMRSAIVTALLDFLETCAKPATPRELGYGKVYGPGDLSPELGRYFATVRLVRAPKINLGLTISRGGSFEPQDALGALLEVMRDKLETKCPLYQEARRARNLSALHLVVHYGRGMLWNTPYHGIGLREGKPVDEMTSRQVISDRASAYAASVRGGAFDRVFLFFDLGARSECRALWPPERLTPR